ncbi:HNH endonuclease family protein [Duganella sp. CT11-25]|uniref:HNH endonuclease family protein n=1 Tax=unclassified Duganella TaxID=2636909 RepID=UPI0039AFBF32
MAKIEKSDSLQYTAVVLDNHMSSILNRKNHVPRFGNLTLVHYGVNRSVQNCAFERKRKEIFEHSNLHLNRGLMQLPTWDEAAIQARGEQQCAVALRIWHGPE